MWLEARLLLGYATGMLSMQLLISSVDLVASAFGGDVDEGVLILLDGHRWWHVLLAPLSLAALAATAMPSINPPESVGSGLQASDIPNQRSPNLPAKTCAISCCSERASWP